MDKSEIIERLKNIASHAVHTVGESPFVISLDDGIAVHEAIELLEQQETTTVTIGRTRGKTTMWYECDACGEPVDLNDNYCRNCGRKLIHD
jgi:electron transfer flavoprotein alpha/beta subunit